MFQVALSEKFAARKYCIKQQNSSFIREKDGLLKSSRCCMDQFNIALPSLQWRFVPMKFRPLYIKFIQQLDGCLQANRSAAAWSRMASMEVTTLGCDISLEVARYLRKWSEIPFHCNSISSILSITRCCPIPPQIDSQYWCFRRCVPWLTSLYFIFSVWLRAVACRRGELIKLHYGCSSTNIQRYYISITSRHVECLPNSWKLTTVSVMLHRVQTTGNKL